MEELGDGGNLNEGEEENDMNEDGDDLWEWRFDFVTISYCPWNGYLS